MAPDAHPGALGQQKKQKEAIADLRDVLQCLIEDGHCSTRVRFGLQCVVDLDDEGVGEIGRDVAVRIMRARAPKADHSVIKDVSTVINRLDKVGGGIFVGG